MTLLNMHLREHLARLQEKAGVDPLSRDFIFHRKHVKDRHAPYPDDSSRTWLSVLLREALTPDVRSTLYPSRFDLGHPSGDTAQSAVLSELIQHLNAPSQPTRKRRGDANRFSKRDLNTTLKGLRQVTGRTLASTQSERPLINLKVIHLLYQLTRNRLSRLFQLIAPPEQVKEASRTPPATLEFKDTWPDPRNADATLLIADLIAYLSVEIDDTRLAQIQAATPPLPELLLSLEKRDALLGRQLRNRSHGDPHQEACAYRAMTAFIETYTPTAQVAQNRLDDALYTYLRTLRFRHYVGGFEQVMPLAAIKGSISPIGPEMSALCDQLGRQRGCSIELHQPILSINAFPHFVTQWAPELFALIEGATGLGRPRNVDRLFKQSTKLLNLYTYFHLGETDRDAEWLSVWDCVAALCTVRHEQATKTSYRPYWYGQKFQGSNLLRHLNVHRCIESLYQDDHVPHGANQILYLRFNTMHAAIIGLREIHEARMAFRLARLKQVARILRLQDVDLISEALNWFDRHCLEQAWMTR